MAVNTKRVTCIYCNQSWARNPCLEVACPLCRAPIGSPCKRPSEHTAQEFHREREQLVVDLGIWKICPKGRTARARRRRRSAA